jgi:hypothetical protein
MQPSLLRLVRNHAARDYIRSLSPGVSDVMTKNAYPAAVVINEPVTPR